MAANEKLTSINMIDLFEMIAHPEPSLRNQTEVLRSIQRMDSTKYNLMKKSLPYFVCAHFDPDYRRKENFSSVSSFVLDIDHVDEKSIHLDDLKAKLAKEDRIAMMFTSPSGCGLKLIFLLNKPGMAVRLSVASSSAAMKQALVTSLVLMSMNVSS